MADTANAMAKLAQQLVLALQQAGAATAAAQPNPTAAVAAKEHLSPFNREMINLASKDNL